MHIYPDPTPTIEVRPTKRSAWQRTKSLGSRCCLVIGMIWVGWHGLVLLATGARDYIQHDKPSATFPSPDQKYKAVVFCSMGGGPGASYCSTSVYVVKMETPDSKIRGDQDLAYAAECGGLAEGHWSENIRWISQTELEISFDPTMGASGGELKIKGYAAVIVW